jgi:hypothetical protein
MHITGYVTNNFHPCLLPSTPFESLYGQKFDLLFGQKIDLLLPLFGQSSYCTWLDYWAAPAKAYQRLACFFSIAIGLLIFNRLMLRTLYAHIFAFSLPCRVWDSPFCFFSRVFFSTASLFFCPF